MNTDLSLSLPLILLGGGATLAVLLGYLGLTMVLDARRKKWNRRLNGHDLSESGTLVPNLSPDKPTMRDRFDLAFDSMIQRTGLELSSAEALGLISFLAVVLAASLVLWRGQLWLGLVGIGLGVFLPLAVFWLMQARYRQQLQAQLPDAFYMLARALRAGLSLEQAMEVVGEQGTKPLGQEFKRCTAYLKLGLTVPAALQLMADRVRLLDFNAFVSAVSFQRTTGGNLAVILDRLAASTRDRNQFRGYLFAATAQARASAIFLACAGPALLLGYAIWQPAHVQTFFSTTTGWMVLAGALTLELLASIWLYNILRIDY
jgi:tight adherence protein B